ncbi:MAG: EamA family transporter [Eggerthellaceae bacterium]|nr:EamA family transporter [Eggerthellaceae bacterium]
MNLPTEIVVTFRGLLGTLFILGVLFATKRRFDAEPVRANLKWLAAGGACLGLNWVLLFAAYRATTVAVASLCNYMAPVILIVVAPPLLGEARSAKKAVCAAVAVIGMVLVSGVAEGGAEGVTGEGVALGLGAAVFAAGLVLSNKKLGKVPVLEKSSTQLAFATIAACPFAIAVGMGQPLEPDPLTIGLVVMLGIVHTGVAYCLYFGGLGHLRAQTAAVLGYVEPAVSVLVSTAFLHEPLSLGGWIGAALIIGAAVASEVLD